mmetsp:Transcript_21492/g.47208  ORF Transcript_21492/g.47208 Transcript_21492/m.47208 type:complete len:267 (-) Transcript_21492:1023-1823(-)
MRSPDPRFVIFCSSPSKRSWVASSRRVSESFTRAATAPMDAAAATRSASAATADWTLTMRSGRASREDVSRLATEAEQLVILSPSSATWDAALAPRAACSAAAFTSPCSSPNSSVSLSTCAAALPRCRPSSASTRVTNCGSSAWTMVPFAAARSSASTRAVSCESSCLLATGPCAAPSARDTSSCSSRRSNSSRTQASPTHPATLPPKVCTAEFRAPTWAWVASNRSPAASTRPPSPCSSTSISADRRRSSQVWSSRGLRRVATTA